MAVRPHIDNSTHLLSFASGIDPDGMITVTINPNQILIVENVRIDISRFNENRRSFAISEKKLYHIRFSLNGKTFNNYNPPSRVSFYLIEADNMQYNPYNIDGMSSFRFKEIIDDDAILAVIDNRDSLIKIIPVFNDREGGVGGGSGPVGQIVDSDVVIMQPVDDIQSTTVHDALIEISAEHSALDHVHPSLVVINEQLNGVNGQNTEFILKNSFMAGSSSVYLNGVRLRNGEMYDYYENPTFNSIIFNDIPWQGDIVLVDYIKSLSV
jgi:hypothetical protein